MTIGRRAGVIGALASAAVAVVLVSLPDRRDVPTKLHATGLFDLRTHHGQGAFVDAVVSTLHGIDPAWGHLRKKPGQTQIHGHGEDAALFKLADGRAQAVDFVGGAGGANPQPGWMVDEPRYTHEDWMDPVEHGGSAPVPPVPAPIEFGYPDENTAGRAFQDRAQRAYIEAARAFPDPNDRDAFRHFMRFGYSSRRIGAEAAADKHIGELRQALGLRPER